MMGKQSVAGEGADERRKQMQKEEKKRGEWLEGGKHLRLPERPSAIHSSLPDSFLQPCNSRFPGT